MSGELKPNTPITQENVGLLKAGDVLRYAEAGLCQLLWSEDDRIGVRYDRGEWTYNIPVDALAYIGPDLGDGWIGWGGGPNPVPGMRVDVRFRNGETQKHGPRSSETWNWQDYGDFDLVIIAFRPALAKPAEGEVWYGDRDPQEVDQAYGEYDGSSCELCGRERVINGGATGKRICEKCGHYQGATPTPPSVDVRPAEGEVRPMRFVGDSDKMDVTAERNPTPPGVDWAVVGPKLVEEGGAIMVAFRNFIASLPPGLCEKHVDTLNPVIDAIDNADTFRAALAAAQPEGK